MIIPINNVGQFGYMADPQPAQLPLNAWTTVENMRFRDLAAEKITGHSQVFGNLPEQPYWLLEVPLSGGFYWLHAGLLDVYVWDGAQHVKITRTAGQYSATIEGLWNGGLLSGIPVINNGMDPPQMWFPTVATNPLSALSGFPPAMTCKVIRPFKNYLFAFDTTENGVRLPYRIRWSQGANPGQLPASWDITNTTIDAGAFDNLMETPDFIVDAARLRDIFVIYKERTTWAAQYIGGDFIFQFWKMFGDLGLLARNCAVEFTSGQHAVFGDTDIAIHDGVQWQSIVDKRIRRWVYSNINRIYSGRSFVTLHTDDKEVWFCFPVNSSLPDMAVVWNYSDGSIILRDLPGTPYIAYGITDSSASFTTWAAETLKWNQQTKVWNTRGYNPNIRGNLMAVPSPPGIFQIDSTFQFNGMSFTSTLERVALAPPLRQGEPPDYSNRKHLNRIYADIDGTPNAVVNVYVGGSDHLGSNVDWNWQGPYQYLVGETQYIDVNIDYRFLAIRFTDDAASYGRTDFWRIRGYELEIEDGGKV